MYVQYVCMCSMYVCMYVSDLSINTICLIVCYLLLALDSAVCDFSCKHHRVNSSKQACSIISYRKGKRSLELVGTYIRLIIHT